VKPGVEVRNVTGPSNPEVAVSVSLNEVLLLVVVDPVVGDPCTIVSGVTVSK
jgi:hypothetical protein